MTDIPSEIVPTDFTDAFDDWLGGASIAKRSVPIYGKPGLFADYQQLERRRQVLVEAAEGDDTLGDPELAQIEADQTALYDEWMASKSTWFLRALTEDETTEVKEPTPVRSDVPELPRHANAEQRAAHDQKVADLRRAREGDAAEENLRAISRAIIRVEFADGRTMDTVSVDQLRRMSVTLGPRQIALLMTEALRTIVEEPEIPAPFSRRTLRTDQTS